MPDATIHYNLQKAGASGVQNKWALYDGNFDRIEKGRTIKALAAAALSARDLVYLDAAQKFAKATNANRPLVGLVQTAAAISTDAYAQTEGPIEDDQATPSWNWTPGALLYADPSTAGALTETPPAGFAPPVAIALTATVIWLFPAGLQLTEAALGIAAARNIALIAEAALVPAIGGAAYLQVDGTNQSEGRLFFDKDAIEKAFWKLAVPAAYDGGNITARVRWRANAVSGDCKWELFWAFFTEPTAWDGALTSVGTVVDSAASSAATPAAYDLLEAPIAISANLPTLGKMWVLMLRRVATDGADTLAVDAELVELVLDYTAAG